MTLYYLVISACLLAFTLFVAMAYKVMEKKLAAQNRIKRVFDTRAHSSEKEYRTKRRRANKKLSLSGRVGMSLSSKLSCAGIKLRVEECLIIWLGLVIGPAGISWLLGSDWIVSIGLLIIGIILPVFYYKYKRTKRIALLEDQLSNALIIIGNCLKTGLSFQHALESIVREMPDPISKEFGRVLKEVQLGLAMETALENMAERLKSKDFMLIVSAVLIQRQVGGSLSDIMQNISGTIRERLQVKSNLRVLTSTGRTSGKIIGLMPVFLMLILMVINPSYIRTFFETEAGTIMLIVASVLEVIGYLVTKRMVRVKY